jgi:hypothetical protein
MRTLMKFCICLILFLIGHALFSQKEFRLQVVDKADNSPLINCNFIIDGLILSSDTSGFINLPVTYLGRKASVRISYVGYKEKQEIILFKENLVISMAQDNTLSEVEIFGSRINNLNGANTIYSTKIQYTPALFSSNDLIRQLQIIPGIKTGVEGTTDLIIRGGNSGQSIFLIDGMEIESNSHLFGLLSPISSTLGKKVSVYKSGFPAFFNNRMSGFIDITTKNYDEYNKTEINFSTLATEVFKKFRVKNRINVTTLLRKSVIDDLTNFYNLHNEYKLNKREEFDFRKDNTGFRDLYFKIENSEKNKLHLGIQYLGSYDFIYDMNKRKELSIFEYTKSSNNWDNQSFQFFLNKRAKNYQNDNSIQFKRNRYDISTYTIKNLVNEPNVENNRAYYTNNSALIAKSLHKFYFEKSGNFNFGATYRVPSTSVGKRYETNQESLILSDTILNASIINSFVSLDKFGSKFEYNVGVNLSKEVNSPDYNWEPRFYFGYHLDAQKSQKLSLSGSRMYQYENLISERPIGKYFKLFLPTTGGGLLPSRNDDVSLGYFLKSDKANLSLETFYKRQYNLYLPKEGQSQQITKEGIKTLESGTNTSYGIEAAVDYNIGANLLYITYTYTYSKLNYDGLNLGRNFENFYNRPHDFSAFYYINRLRKNWRANLGFTIKSGIPATIYKYYYRDISYVDLAKQPRGTRVQTSGTVAVDERFGVLLPNLNNHRFPLYHRFDVNFIKDITKSKYKSFLTIGFYNLYGRRNPIELIHEAKLRTVTINGQQPVLLFEGFNYKYKSYFIFVPSISYNIHFN